MTGNGRGESQAGGVDSATARRPGPVRMCVGCRKRAPKTEFVRVIAVQGDLVPDVSGRLPGRGAHLHPDSGCLDLAERRRAFPRALRLPGPLATTALRHYVEDEMQSFPHRAASDANVESRSSDAMSAR